MRTRDFDNHLSSAGAASCSRRHAGINPHNPPKMSLEPPAAELAQEHGGLALRQGALPSPSGAYILVA
jgi:hypothetical protein